MILGYEESKILRLATEYQSNMTDGVVQYNYETGKLYGAGFTTGTLENPANPVIEVFRLPQGEMGEIDMKCHETGECPFVTGFYDEEHRKLFPTTKIECCIDAYVDDGFEEYFDDYFKEDLESQIRDVLSDHLGKTISKLNDIRIAISDRVAPYDYFNVRQDDWEMRVLDFYVDSAMEDGFTLIEPTDYLDSEICNLSGICENSTEDVEFWTQVANKISDYDFDGALEMLQ